MSVYELSPSNTNTIAGRRDIVYANGEAIAEIDQNNNIYELHNDYLGSPRYITNGNINQNNQSTTGKIVGEQAFGPYGEQMTVTFNSGYRPVTGYTGHINEDSTGLIYMRGRYYSPKWHRFINSDQGVDPNSINQFAYVNGMPFMATDPSGMSEVIDTKQVLYMDPIICHDCSLMDYYMKMQNLWRWLTGGGDRLEISDPGPRSGGGGGAGSSSGSGQNAQQNKNQNDDCGGGFFDSIKDTFSSITGFYNPSNWNTESMSRLYELGPLGQAEAHGDAAYYATAGSLAFAGVAVGGAVAVNAINVSGGGAWLYQQTGGSKMLTGNPYLRIGWGKGKDGYHWFRMATDKLGNKRIHMDVLKGPKTGCKK